MTFTLTGELKRFDGGPAAGKVTIETTPGEITNTALDVVFASPLVVPIDPATGTFSQELPHSDDPDLVETGFTYTISVSLHHAQLETLVGIEILHPITEVSYADLYRAAFGQTLTERMAAIEAELANIDTSVTTAQAAAQASATSAAVALTREQAAEAAQAAAEQAETDAQAAATSATASQTAAAASAIEADTSADAAELDRVAAQTAAADADADRVAAQAAAAAAAVSAARAPIEGVGFPEGIVTATPGRLYIDTAATNGAVVWVKTTGTGNTGWKVSYGDTGWRDITTLLGNGWAIVGAGPRIRRVNDRIVLQIRWRLNGSAATSSTFMICPTGFRPRSNTGLNALSVGVIRCGTGATDFSVTPVTSQEDVSSLSISTRFILHEGEVSWTTGEAWPTSLPGVPG